MIKEETITKTLNFLNETKKKISECNTSFNPKLLSKLLRVSNAKYYFACKLGYFSSKKYPDSNRFYCHVDKFEPYHARNVIEAENKKRIHKTTWRDIVHNNHVELNKNILLKDKFVPPSLSEVEKYCNERRNDVNPAKFMSHYEQNGWMVGKNKMKNWKMAINTWEHQNYYYACKKLSEYTIEELIDELKRRGYTGNILPPSNEIKF